MDWIQLVEDKEQGDGGRGVSNRSWQWIFELHKMCVIS